MYLDSKLGYGIGRNSGFGRTLEHISLIKCLHYFDLTHFRGKGRYPYKIFKCKGQKISKANYGFFNSSKKQTKLTILSIFST